jgi:peptidoglycan hydrolase-like protein with peptidoglycan-binding domain
MFLLRLPSAAVFTLLALLLGSLVTLAHESPARPVKDSADRHPLSAGSMPVLTERRHPSSRRPAALRPVATDGGAWSGHAFDACRAPSQRTMDRWLHRSPFVGVGIYLGGIHRACEQKHLTPGWVSRQTRRGWQLLPIWVGPQASCTGYSHRIPDSTRGSFAAARRAGTREARAAKATARRLGMGSGQTVFYDIEPYDASRGRCRRAAMVFLDAWTRELHKGGFRSGVYSHVRAAIASISRAPRGFARPDAVWYAWIDRPGTMPRKYVDDPSFMRTSRVHQYALDRRVRFGGISMAIDWNLVSLGTSAVRGASASCGRPADRLASRRIRPGERGRHVQVVECLLRAAGTAEGQPRRVYDDITAAAVRTFQRKRGLSATGVVERRTLTALFAHGQRPLLKRGSTGEPVRRLQRSLNVALPRPVAVDGAFGPATEAAVRGYHRRLGRAPHGVVTPSTWRALATGTTAGSGLRGATPPRAEVRPKAKARPTTKTRPTTKGKRPATKPKPKPKAKATKRPGAEHTKKKAAPTKRSPRRP